jgi:hypothetical protein
LFSGDLMTKRVFAASHERGIKLMAAGCPLDYPEALPFHSVARRKPFRARQLDGYVESRVYALGPLVTAYLIGLHLGTDRPSGTVISEWSFVPPWKDHLVSWDYEPLDIIPKGQRGDYKSVLDSPLMGVLNERRLLRRGYPVEGLLCGCSAQPVEEAGDGLVSAQLTFVDDRGNTIALRIALTVIRHAATRSKKSPAPAGRLFDRMHKLASHGGR